MMVNVPLPDGGARILIAGTILDWGLTVIVPLAPNSDQARAWYVARVDERARQVHVWPDGPQDTAFLQGAALVADMTNAMRQVGYGVRTYAGRP